MRERCHKGLAELVGAYGSAHIHKKFLPELSIASVEPDLENRQNIENNLDDLPKIIPILSKWFIEHTIGAKELAILNLRNSYEARLKDDPSWINFLGLIFHYITDWGTPYHSPVSLANPVIPTTVIGGISIGILRIIINWVNGSSEILNGVTKWGLSGAAALGGISLISLYLEHKNFEEQCNEYWDNNKNLIIKQFLSQKKDFHLPRNFEEAIGIFEEKMNDLRIICNYTSPDWILSNRGENFADYMVQIAVVMDFAIQIIGYY